MKRGPQPNTRAGKPSLSARAAAAWAPSVPEEIVELARVADLGTASAVATRLGYSPAVISQLIGNKYPGDVSRVFEKIRGALLGQTLGCPILGEIGRDRCLDEQKRPFAATNSIRARLYHACKACPHNRKKEASHD